MSRPMGWLALALLLTVATCVSAQTELERARQMLLEFDQQVHESAEAARREGRQPEFRWEGYNRRLLQVQGLINQGIVSALDRQPRPSGQELQNELREVVSLGVGPETKAGAFSFQTATRKLYVVAYALGVLAANSRSWIGVFGCQGEGKACGLLASVENSLPDKTIAVQPLSHPGEPGLTFLAYGINWGDAHNRLTVIAYSFAGQKLKAIWSHADLPQGQVKVRDGKIELDFLSSPLGPGYRSVHAVTEVYRLTSAGVRLESTRRAKQ